MSAAEVVVVGGGVVGASVAYHLALRGTRDVLVLERGAAPGEGSTGRATGGFRAQFGSAPNVALSLLSREKLLRFRDETGVDPGYRPTGYLFLARTPAELAQLAAALEVQRAAGSFDARLVGPDEARALNPAVRWEGVGGTFSAADGAIRPLEILRGYTEAAARLGVRFRYGAEVSGMEVEGGRVRAVRTSGGSVGAGVVVNAAGAWAARVAAWAGVELPVRPLRRQVALTTPCTLLPEEMPLTIFCEDGFHLRVRDGRILLLRPDDPPGPDFFDTSVDPGWVEDVLRRARVRLPCTRSAVLDSAACWAGLYEQSPDHHVLLGRAPGTENLFLANGSSGHGVMHAPALGHLLAEIVLDGAASAMDTRPLRPERFAEGDPVAGSALL